MTHTKRYFLTKKKKRGEAYNRGIEKNIKNPGLKWPPPPPHSQRVLTSRWYLLQSYFCCYNIAQNLQTEEFNRIRNSSDADVRNTYITLTVWNADNFIDRLHTRNGIKYETYCKRLRPGNNDHPEFPSRVTVLLLLLVSTQHFEASFHKSTTTGRKN